MEMKLDYIFVDEVNLLHSNFIKKLKIYLLVCSQHEPTPGIALREQARTFFCLVISLNPLLPEIF
jgi:hypothetical protein